MENMAYFSVVFGVIYISMYYTIRVRNKPNVVLNGMGSQRNKDKLRPWCLHLASSHQCGQTLPEMFCPRHRHRLPLLLPGRQRRPSQSENHGSLRVIPMSHREPVSATLMKLTQVQTERRQQWTQQLPQSKYLAPVTFIISLQDSPETVFEGPYLCVIRNVLAVYCGTEVLTTDYKNIKNGFMTKEYISNRLRFEQKMMTPSITMHHWVVSESSG